MALERKVAVSVDIVKGQDSLGPALDQTKSKADAATTSLEKAKTAGSQVAAAGVAVPAGAAVASAPATSRASAAPSTAIATSGATASAQVRTPDALEKSIDRQEAALRRSIATFGMSGAEIKIWDAANKGATASQLQNVQALAAQQRGLKDQAAAAREAARDAKTAAAEQERQAKAAGLFGQQNNQLQERISKVQRVAGLAGMALAAGNIGGPAGNIAGAALGGAAAGAMLGPWGAAIGAAVGGLGAFAQSLGSATEKMAEAGKRASTIFSGEATLRALRRGDVRPTDAALLSAAPEALDRISRLRPAERAAGLRREAGAATTERERVEALPRAADTSAFHRFAESLDVMVGLRADLSTPEMITRARTTEAALAGAVRAVDTGEALSSARVAPGSSGGAGFVADSITSALLAEPDESTSILREIRDALVTREDALSEIRRILSPGAT